MLLIKHPQYPRVVKSTLVLMSCRLVRPSAAEEKQHSGDVNGLFGRAPGGNCVAASVGGSPESMEVAAQGGRCKVELASKVGGVQMEH